MKKTILFIFCIIFTLPIYAYKMHLVSGQALRKLVSDKMVIINYASPHLSGLNLNTMGNNLIVALYKDGSMHGIFARSNTTNGAATMDTGHWQIKHNKEFCGHWNSWEQHKVVCVYWFSYGDQYILLHPDHRLAGIINKTNII